MGAFFPILVAIGVFLFSIYLYNRAYGKSSSRERLHGMFQRPGQQVVAEDEEFQEYEEFEKEKSPLADMIERALMRLNVDPENYREELELKLAQAGITSPNALAYYAFFKNFGWIPGLIVGGFVFLMAPDSGLLKYVVWIIALLVAFYFTKAAELYLKNKKDKRQYILQRSFPDGLDLVLVCVEAGLALDAALARVCRELDRAHPELTYEFNKTRMELTLLNDRQKALKNLAERTDMMAFRSFTGALLQSERFGTSLTETLRVLSEDYRNTRMMVAENKAGKLPALMTIPVMTLMLPALFLIIMAPAIIELVATYSTSSVYEDQQ